MTGILARRSIALGLGMVLMLTVVPACRGGGHLRRNAPPVTQPAAVPYVVYRPGFESTRGSRLFIGGYAGYNYGAGPRGPLLPTGWRPGRGLFGHNSGHAH